jgi:plasmid stability protein
MPSLTIKDIPDEVLAGLRARAAADRRSMSKEAIYLLERALSAEVGEKPARLREQARAQVEAWTRLAGRWRSDVDAATEIEAIYSARSSGRAIEL